MIIALLARHHLSCETLFLECFLGRTTHLPAFGWMIATDMIAAYNETRSSLPFEYTTLAGYDEGDCCSCTCDPNGYYDCGEFGYDCIDPEAACVDDDDGVTENVASSCVPAFSSNGFCDPDNNNELCGMWNMLSSMRQAKRSFGWAKA